jgi:hypothetical protein
MLPPSSAFEAPLRRRADGAGERHQDELDQHVEAEDEDGRNRRGLAERHDRQDQPHVADVSVARGGRLQPGDMDALAQAPHGEGERGGEDGQRRQRRGENELPVEQLLERRVRDGAVDHRRQGEIEHQDVQPVPGALLDVEQPRRDGAGEHQPEEGQGKVDDVGHEASFSIPRPATVLNALPPILPVALTLPKGLRPRSGGLC